EDREPAAHGEPRRLQHRIHPLLRAAGHEGRPRLHRQGAVPGLRHQPGSSFSERPAGGGRAGAGGGAALPRVGGAQRPAAGRGGEWKDSKPDRRQALLGVQLDRLKEHTEARAWAEAVELGARLAETYTEDVDRKQMVNPLGALAEACPDDDVRLLKRLRVLAERYAGTELVERVVARLKKRAKELLADAEETEKEWEAKKETAPAQARKAKERAEALSRQAEEVWPYVPGLRAFQIRVGGAAHTLRVGVRQLPEYLSPALAVTDAERRAVELLFESLVKP